MAARVDPTGRTYANWEVVSRLSRRLWECRCLLCGVIYQRDAGSIRHGRSTQCQSCSTTASKTTHGESDTRLYVIWCGMISRCCNENSGAYPRYGGRGILLCEEWRESYPAFSAWAKENGYSEELTIERIENNEGYHPGNCRWATYKEQGRNTRRNRYLTFNGKRVLIGDLSADCGIPSDVLKNRIFRYGWDIETAMSAPVGKRGERPS